MRREVGADLFGSYVATILATMVLGREVIAAGDNYNGMSPIILPMVIAGLGIVFSLIGILAVVATIGLIGLAASKRRDG